MSIDKIILASIGKEVKTNTPNIIANTAKKFGIARAKKQKKAIIFSKARKAGANLPYKGA